MFFSCSAFVFDCNLSLHSWRKLPHAVSQVCNSRNRHGLVQHRPTISGISPQSPSEQCRAFLGSRSTRLPLRQCLRRECWAVTQPSAWQIDQIMPDNENMAEAEKKASGSFWKRVGGVSFSCEVSPNSKPLSGRGV